MSWLHIIARRLIGNEEEQCFNSLFPKCVLVMNDISYNLSDGTVNQSLITGHISFLVSLTIIASFWRWVTNAFYRHLVLSDRSFSSYRSPIPDSSSVSSFFNAVQACIAQGWITPYSVPWSIMCSSKWRFLRYMDVPDIAFVASFAVTVFRFQWVESYVDIFSSC